jgi:hypothetical protein
MRQVGYRACLVPCWELNLGHLAYSLVAILTELSQECCSVVKHVCFVLQLRHDMIDQKEGETELSVKIHYDDMVSVNTTQLLFKESTCQ